MLSLHFLNRRPQIKGRHQYFVSCVTLAFKEMSVQMGVRRWAFILMEALIHMIYAQVCANTLLVSESIWDFRSNDFSSFLSILVCTSLFIRTALNSQGAVWHVRLGFKRTINGQFEAPHKDRNAVRVLELVAAAVCLLQIETILIKLIWECTPPIVHTEPLLQHTRLLLEWIDVNLLHSVKTDVINESILLAWLTVC